MVEKIAKCFGKYKKYAIIGPIAIMLEVLLEVYIPLVLGKLIDEGADKVAIYGYGYIYKIGLFLLALTICSLCCGALSGYASSIAGTGLAKNLRTKLFDKITLFSFNNIDKFSTSSLITRLTVDINNTQMAVMMILRICARAPFMLVMATVMAFTINKDVAWIFLITIPVLGGALIAIVFAAFPKFQKMLGFYDVMNRDLQENLIGIRAVKAYVRESDQIDKFENTSKQVCWAQIQAEKIVAMNGPVMQTIVGLTLASVLFFGGKQIIIGKMDAGMIMTFVTYGMQILMSLMMLSMVVVTLVLSKASITRICEVLDEEIDVQDTEAAIKKGLKVKDGSIEFKNVSFKYSFHMKSSEENTKEYEEKYKKEKYKKKHKLESQLDLFEKTAEHFKSAVEKITDSKDSTKTKAAVGENNFVLTDINLKINSGETIGVIGGTGSSKTTLISMIPRLYDATKGKVLVGGVDVKEYTKKNLRDAVAVVLQKNVLFSGSIKENLKWGNENATDEEIIAAAKIANAHEFVSESIDGYNTELGQGGVNVSGGQKQRLTIARALLKNPKVLILDDSMSAVDTKTDASIRRALKAYSPDTTKIIIAQRISSIYDADKIIVLDDGKITGFGTHDELLKTNEIYKDIYNSQAEGGMK